MLYLLIYSWVVFALDWSSTIEAHDYRVEENPFMRDVWCKGGDIGFTLVSIAFALLMHLVIAVGWKHGNKWAVVVAALPVLTFKLIIALTNLAIAPYSWTSWWQY